MRFRSQTGVPAPGSNDAPDRNKTLIRHALLQIQRFDGRSFSFEDRPYVIMRDRAFVDLGSWQPS
jgi:hypothetical protein